MLDQAVTMSHELVQLGRKIKEANANLPANLIVDERMMEAESKLANQARRVEGEL